MISDQMSVLNIVTLKSYDLWNTSMQSYSHITEHALHVIVTSYHYWVCSNLNMWNFDHGTISTCVCFVLFFLFCARFRFRFSLFSFCSQYFMALELEMDNGFYDMEMYMCSSFQCNCTAFSLVCLSSFAFCDIYGWAHNQNMNGLANIYSDIWIIYF